MYARITTFIVSSRCITIGCSFRTAGSQERFDEIANLLSQDEPLKMLELDNLFSDAGDASDGETRSDPSPRNVESTRRGLRGVKPKGQTSASSAAGKPLPPRETIPSLPLPRHSIVEVKPATSRRDQFASRACFASVLYGLMIGRVPTVGCAARDPVVAQEMKQQEGGDVASARWTPSALFGSARAWSR
jgi:hypothetical protein